MNKQKTFQEGSNPLWTCNRQKSIRGNPSAEIRRFPRMDFCTRVWMFLLRNVLLNYIIFITSPFRNRVAKLRGPSEGLGGNAANVWSTQLQAVQQWNAMWYFHITSTRDIFRSERWRFSQIKIVLAVWKMQTPCCHVLVECVCVVDKFE